MLVYQAQANFKIWFNIKPKIKKEFLTYLSVKK